MVLAYRHLNRMRPATRLEDSRQARAQEIPRRIKGGAILIDLVTDSDDDEEASITTERLAKVWRSNHTYGLQCSLPIKRETDNSPADNAVSSAFKKRRFQTSQDTALFQSGQNVESSAFPTLSPSSSIPPTTATRDLFAKEATVLARVLAPRVEQCVQAFAEQEDVPRSTSKNGAASDSLLPYFAEVATQVEWSDVLSSMGSATDSCNPNNLASTIIENPTATIEHFDETPDWNPTFLNQDNIWHSRSNSLYSNEVGRVATLRNNSNSLLRPEHDRHPALSTRFDGDDYMFIPINAMPKLFRQFTQRDKMSYKRDPGNQASKRRRNRSPKRRPYASKEGIEKSSKERTSCHQCGRRKSSLMRCRNHEDGKVCTKAYCESCLRDRYGEAWRPESFQFSCPSCSGYCTCTDCLERSGMAAFFFAILADEFYGRDLHGGKAQSEYLCRKRKSQLDERSVKEILDDKHGKVFLTSEPGRVADQNQFEGHTHRPTKSGKTLSDRYRAKVLATRDRSISDTGGDESDAESDPPRMKLAALIARSQHEGPTYARTVNRIHLSSSEEELIGRFNETTDADSDDAPWIAQKGTDDSDSCLDDNAKGSSKSLLLEQNQYVPTIPDRGQALEASADLEHQLSFLPEPDGTIGNYEEDPFAGLATHRGSAGT